MSGAPRWAVLLAVAGCAEPLPGGAEAPDAEAVDLARPDAGGLDAAASDRSAADSGEPCLPGWACDPILIDRFPARDLRDTRSGESRIDRHDCAPEIDESGPELHYRLELPSRGALSIAVDDLAGDDIDVDLHLHAGGHCIARDNRRIGRVLDGGSYTLIVDTWVDRAGRALAGPYALDASFLPFGRGPCAMREERQAMFWRECAPATTFTCTVASDGRAYLSLPAVGPVALEAHLVTDRESFPGGWPSSFTDGIANHYAISEALSGYRMTRREPWAPAGEGGSRFGQGATGRPVPALDEAWYVNMYWRTRPAGGTRLIVLNPENGRAVVASGGYETGPGSNTAIGGAAEEIHHHLGSGHRSSLVMGFAIDPALPLGPIDCAP